MAHYFRALRLRMISAWRGAIMARHLAQL